MTAWGSVAELLGDDLEDIEYLGRGSSGTVYRATQRSLGRTVAVKVFRQFADEETDRVLAEAKAQGSLSWHANVVSLYDHGTTPDGFPYLIMEYAPGGSLEDRVRERGKQPEEQWRRYGAELASALSAAHEAGVVHCDVKPSNVLFAADGSVRLADFGIAKVNGMSTGTIDSIEGSLGYVAPELLEGDKPTAESDVYSLAITLGCASTGEPPLGDDLTLAQAVAAVHSGLPAERVNWTGLSTEAGEAMRRACSSDPNGRPSAAEVARVLADHHAPPSGSATRRSAGPPFMKLGVAAITVCLAVVGLLLVRPSPPDLQPAGASTKPFDLCAEYESYVRERTEVFDGASTMMELSTSPVDATNQLLRSYPDQFGTVAASFIHRVLRHTSLQGEVTADQLATMAMADNLRVLGGGKPFLFDGTSGGFDPAVLPVYLAQPSKVFSDVNRYASDRCPDVADDFAPARARMSSAIYSNLTDSVFMEGFFSDPRSLEILDTRTTILISNYAWQFFEGLVMEHPAWFMDLLRRHEDIRRVLSFEHPETLLQIADNVPAAQDQLRAEKWRNDLQEGIDRRLPMERIGIASTYGSELKELGLELD